MRSIHRDRPGQFTFPQKIVALGVAIFSVVSPIHARCIGSDTTHATSVTCWHQEGKPYYSNDYRAVIVSTASLERVRELAIQQNASLGAVFSDLEKDAERNNVRAVGFLLAVAGTKQKNCLIYGVDEHGLLKIEGMQPIDRLGTPPSCRKSLFDIGYAVASLNDEERNSTIEGPAEMHPQYALFTGSVGAEALIFAQHPNKQWANLVKGKNTSKALLFVLTHYDFSNLAIPENASFETIPYPVNGYTVLVGDTLGGIARQTTGDYNNWPILWAMNREAIKNPKALKAGAHIKIPAKIKDWVEVPVMKDERPYKLMSVGALKHTPPKLTEYVFRACSKRNPMNSSCQFPVFAGPKPLATAPVAKLSN